MFFLSYSDSEVVGSKKTKVVNKENLPPPNKSPDLLVSFSPNTVPLPMDSKIDFGKYEPPIFSPPNQTKPTKRSIPDFIRVLDPTVYNQIQQQGNVVQTPPNKKSKKDEDQVADSIVKHTLNTNHLYFPGECSFVSSINIKYIDFF